MSSAVAPPAAAVEDVLDDVLDTEAVGPRLATQWLGRRYHHRTEVTSTNDVLTHLAQQGAPAGTVVVAEAQSQGRGRRGRSWQAAPGQNLTFSLLLRPGWRPPRLPPLSLAVGVGLAQALAPWLPCAPQLKWPNDLLVGGRKLAGVLVELAADAQEVRHAVVGIGINVNQLDFPDELSATATSLRREHGAPIGRATVLAAALAALEAPLEAALRDQLGPVLQQWTALAAGLGQSVVVTTPQGAVAGVVSGIDADGALRVRDAEGRERRLLAGDVLLGPRQAGARAEGRD
ncbi:MAG: biotin--[acetyl-CoA-carboxylase] ligase [Proteobacteria bacterium]|nr:biotin--[acetyl-CoA-carboxylase] ligase [Pseudomonadota bacterium]